MGSFLGLLFGLGWLLVLTPPSTFSPVQGGLQDRTRDLLARAGIVGVTPRQLLGVSVGLALTVSLAVFVICRTATVALAFGLLAAAAPRALVARQARRRSVELRDLWPEVVDNLVSAIRAGMSLPEAVGALSGRGPEQLRPAFRAFADDHRATGSFHFCLQQLAERLADPVGDRLCAALGLAREVGGTDLGRLLRTLSAFLREDARARAELEARQSATVNAARLGLSAPWIVLLLLASQSSTIQAYDSPGGALVLFVGGGVSFAAFRIMLRIGRLPMEPRVLRPAPGGRTA